MPLFAARGDRHLTKFDREALRQGVLRAGETWLATATGHVVSYTRTSRYTTRYHGLPPVSHLGITRAQFFALTNSDMVIFDLLMLASAQFTSTEGKLPSAFIAWLGDEVASMGHITVYPSPESTITSTFVRQIEEATKNRKGQFLSEVVQNVEDWRGEIFRRDRETSICEQVLERAGPAEIKAELPITMRCILEPNTGVGRDVEPLISAHGKLQLRADGKIVARVEPHYTVAVFTPSQVSRLSVPGPTANPKSGGRWAIAYVGTDGPRYLAFDAPTMALHLGMLEESCDEFLHNADLKSKITFAPPEEPSTETGPRTQSSAPLVDREQSPPRRPRPKRRN